MVRDIDKLAAGISQPAAHVLAALASRADDGDVCFPSEQLLSRETGMSERHVRRCVTELRQLDLVGVEQGRQHVPNRYTLRADRLSSLPRVQGGQPVRSDEGSGRTSTPARADKTSIPGRTNCPPKIQEKKIQEDPGGASAAGEQSSLPLTGVAPKGRAKPPAPEGTQRVIAAFVDAVRELRGEDVRVPIDGKEKGGAIALIGKAGSADQAIAVLRYAFETDRRVQDQPGLAFIASSFMRYAGRVPELAVAPAPAAPTTPAEPYVSREHLEKALADAGGFKPRQIDNLLATGADRG